MKSLFRSLPFVSALSCVTCLGLLPREARANPNVSIGVSISAHLPHGHVRIDVGRQPYYYHRGVFYREGPRGYVVVRAPRGAVVRELPPRHVRVMIEGAVFYRVDDVYYRTCPDGYVVVDAPVVVARTASKVVPPSGYESVWLGDVEYLVKDGEFFRKTPDGLVWQEAPLGAITRNLPRDATSIWHEDVEYFEVGDTYFRKTPDGYKVIEAPWKGSDEISADSSEVKDS